MDRQTAWWWIMYFIMYTIHIFMYYWVRRIMMKREDVQVFIIMYTCLCTGPGWWAGEGRRPWATTISPSVPHISFFLFRQPWATTISPSVPPHLTLPGKTTFLTQTIFSILLKINILCVEFLNCLTMKFLTNLTEYCTLKYHKVG